MHRRNQSEKYEWGINVLKIAAKKHAKRNLTKKDNLSRNTKNKIEEKRTVWRREIYRSSDDQKKELENWEEKTSRHEHDVDSNYNN